MQPEKCHCFLSVLPLLKIYERHLLHQAVATGGTQIQEQKDWCLEQEKLLLEKNG